MLIYLLPLALSDGGGGGGGDVCVCVGGGFWLFSYANKAVSGVRGGAMERRAGDVRG